MTTIVYKLTDKNLRTYNGFQWTPGEWRETSGVGGLCGPGWLHAYTEPLLAVLLNPIHANISDPVLFRAEAEGSCKGDRGLKVGFPRMRIVERMELPVVTIEQLVRFAILCAWKVCTDPAWRKWAAAWLDGSDRSALAAEAAASRAALAAEAASRAALVSRAERVALASRAERAALAAEAASRAALAATEAAELAARAARAAREAARAARAAARAAELAELAAENIDLVAIAKEATKP